LLFERFELLEGLLEVTVDAGLVNGKVLDVSFRAEFHGHGDGSAEVSAGVGPSLVYFFLLERDAQEVGFAAEMTDALKAPEVLSETAKYGEFEFAGVGAAAEDVLKEMVETVDVFAGNDAVLGGEAVFEGVTRADLLAGVGFGAVRLGSVGARGVALGRCGGSRHY
jgi:hypothetical protein